MILYPEILDEALRKIPGAIKSNEIPNAQYLLYQGWLIINLYDTLLHLIQMKDPMSINNNAIGFTIQMGLDKKLYPNSLPTVDTNKLINYYNQYLLEITTSNILAIQDNLQDDPDYAELLKLKSAEGLKYFKLHYAGNLVFIPVFNGFPALVKNDTISVEVYEDNTDNRYCWVRYKIYKSKLKDYMYSYFRLLQL